MRRRISIAAGGVMPALAAAASASGGAVVRQQGVAIDGLASRAEPAHAPGALTRCSGEPSAGPRHAGSQLGAEAYRPVADGQPGRAGCERAASASGRDGGAARALLARRAGRDEHLAAARVDHRQHGAVGAGGPGQRARASRRRASSAPAAWRQRARGGDPDPQPGERARARRRRTMRVDVGPAARPPASSACAASGSSCCGVARALARRRVVAQLDRLAGVRSGRPPPSRASRCRARDDHGSTSMRAAVRRRACARRTRRATRARGRRRAARARATRRRRSVAGQLVGQQPGSSPARPGRADRGRGGDGHAAVLVAVADREGRARHRARDAERARGAAHERRLARRPARRRRARRRRAQVAAELAPRAPRSLGPPVPVSVAAMGGARPQRRGRRASSADAEQRPRRRVEPGARQLRTRRGRRAARVAAGRGRGAPASGVGGAAAAGAGAAPAAGAGAARGFGLRLAAADWPANGSGTGRRPRRPARAPRRGPGRRARLQRRRRAHGGLSEASGMGRAMVAVGPRRVSRRRATSCCSPTATGRTRRAAAPARTCTGRSPLAGVGSPRHGRRRRLRRAPSRSRSSDAAPDDPPDGHAPDRLPARGVGRAARASRATPTSCSRSSTGSPSSRRCGGGCARRGSRSSTTSTRTTTSPSSGRAGAWPRCLLEHAAAAAPLPRRRRS